MSNGVTQVNVISRESVYLICIQIKLLASERLKRHAQYTAA